MVKILIWHGYLLSGTGSNVYTRSLARAWSQAGHEVVVLCQARTPSGTTVGGAAVVRPRLDGRLPVFVLDDYEDAAPQLLQDMCQVERDRFVEQNAEAIRAQGHADLLLVNHVLLGGPVGAASGLPYVVKAHGFELEYSMRGDPGLCAWARQALEPARVVLAGSEHVGRVLDELVGPDPARIRVIPPGVDTERFRPQDRAGALTSLLAECARDAPNPQSEHDERRPNEGNMERLARLFAGDRRTVLYVGKLSDEKGVSLLLDALHRVDARAVIVGFGPARAELEASAGPDVLFTGPLEHRHLQHLWPLADVSVTPSVFPEAFGMVAAEAAACGSPPLVARHFGLAEVAAGLAAEYPERLRHLASFERSSTDHLTDRLTELLALPARDWQEVASATRRAAERLWSWDQVARRILEAARLQP